MAHSHAAPWKSEFTAHVGKMKSPEFVLSTIAPAPAGSFSSASYQPRARYCVFRGMWAELPANEKNPAERNPAIYESDCLTLTTDVRMQKVGELFASASSGATGREAPSAEGSGGGGPVEAVWWVKEDGIMTQWRVKGDAFVLAPDVEKSPESEGIRLLKKEVGERMKCKDEKREGEWSWARELTAHFGNQSPVIRGSFRAPPPGKPVTESYDERNLKMGTRSEDIHDSIARQNFRVIIIRPTEVESTDLSDPSKSRRQLYTYEQSKASWKHEELWP